MNRRVVIPIINICLLYTVNTHIIIPPQCHGVIWSYRVMLLHFSKWRTGYFVFSSELGCRQGEFLLVWCRRNILLIRGLASDWRNIPEYVHILARCMYLCMLIPLLHMLVCSIICELLHKLAAVFFEPKVSENVAIRPANFHGFSVNLTISTVVFMCPSHSQGYVIPLTPNTPSSQT